MFVLRDLLTFAKSKADGEAMVSKAKRTWAIWIGLGDFATKELDLVGYKENSAIVYNDQTIGSMTGQPYLENICYVDKHPQPSGDGVNGTLPSALENFYGHIDQQATKQIVQHHQTGDVHWALVRQTHTHTHTLSYPRFLVCFLTLLLFRFSPTPSHPIPPRP